MADNLGIHTGTDATVATDEIAGVHYEKIKILSGKADSTTPIIGDATTGAIVQVTYPHHEVHEGDAFTASYAVDLAGGAVADILIVTPDTAKWAHLTWKVESELEAHAAIWEAPTATASASAIVAYNRQRNAGGASGLVLTHTPTSITTGTTLIRDVHMGSGRSVGGSRADAEEFILKQGTKYLFRVTNSVSNANNYVSVWLDWYEHQNLS
jgi:hypothetical protein